MRCAIVDPAGDHKYVYVDREPPSPGPGEVVLQMRAASLNWRDNFLRLHHDTGYGDARGRVPLSDGVGVVAALGAGVAGFALGDRVCPNFFLHWVDGAPTVETIGRALGGSLDGVLAEEMVVPAACLVHAPAHLTDAEAATLPCAGVTAWVSLVERGQARAGDTVLVQGTGGVSVFVLQFAKALGVRTIVISSSDEKLERARALGADETLNYRAHPDWDVAARELTDGRGVDHIVEVGGAETLPRSLNAMALGAHLAIVGGLTGFGAEIPTSALAQRFARLSIVYVGARASFERMNDFIAAQRIRPPVDRTFGFEEGQAAAEQLASGAHFGKLAIQIAA